MRSAGSAFPAAAPIRASRAPVAPADRNRGFGKALWIETPKCGRAQQRIAAVAGEHFVPAIALQHDLYFSAQLAGQQEQRNIRRVGERLIVRLHQGGQDFVKRIAADAQLVMIEPERLGHAPRFRQLIDAFLVVERR